MKTFLVVAATVCTVFSAALPRVKRAAYDLPAGAEEVVGQIQTSFTCPDTVVYMGLYADVANRCQIFHICERNPLEGMIQTSFFCGNQTVFNQLTLTCASYQRAIPCNLAPDFYYINDKIGIPDAVFLTDEDIARARAAFQRG